MKTLLLAALLASPQAQALDLKLDYYHSYAKVIKSAGNYKCAILAKDRDGVFQIVKESIPYENRVSAAADCHWYEVATTTIGTTLFYVDTSKTFGQEGFLSNSAADPALDLPKKLRDLEERIEALENR